MATSPYTGSAAEITPRPRTLPKTRNEMFRIVAINPNRPKYPISAERVSDGRGFKFPANNVVLYLRNPQS